MRRHLSWLTGLVACAALTGSAAPPTRVLDHDTAVHVLNRLTFGPTTRDVARLRASGLDGWLAAQLRPDRIDDPGLDERLGRLTTVTMTPRELAEAYYIPALERRRAAQARAGASAAVDPTGGEVMSPPGETGTPADRPARPMAGRRPEQQVALELITHKLVRVTASERQLEEVLVDFWFNHFNVFAGKGPVRQYVADFERTAIRPHVLGSFRDMLGAVAAHPAMLFYLDNWQSSAAGTRTMRGTMGLNENYARELLELHTLGVDGGYTQHDIVEVARAFTGWTIRLPRAGGDFVFDGRRHDRGSKTILGTTIGGTSLTPPFTRNRDTGREDGERVLDLLARHPSTARHIATKLARRFVSDTPPEALVARVAARFTTRGDLRATMEALVRSPEFLAPEARLAKVKTPLEFVASAVRVLGADIAMGGALGQQLQTMGMPPYFSQPPTGYSDRADAWTNAGALVQRMNLAVALTAGRMRGVGRPSLPVVIGDDADSSAQSMARALLFREPSPSTLQVVARARTAPEMAALLLGSPEFQRK